MGVQERKARQRENLRQEILDAARILFVREGYANVSIRKIAERIEYSPGTIYLYFEDKAEILISLCEETFAKLTERLRAIHEDPGPPIGAMRRGLRTYAEFALEYPQHYLVTFVVSPEDFLESPSMERLLKAGIGCFENMRQIVSRCIQEDTLRITDVDEASQVLWSGIHGVCSLLLTKPMFPFIERTRLVDSLVETMIEGVRKK